MATFIFPTVKRVTSHFRTKNRPNHHGTDFAQSGYHEIKAAAAGKVVKSYTSSSYGECIIIRHTINGQTWETLYAHMRKGSRRVKVGDTVKQGQVIGVMGNTGDSTGQHLHFELHKGTWNINKSNAVDPMKYLGKDLYPKKKESSSSGTYTIKAGDTFWDLEKKFGLKHGTLQKLNPNVDPRKLKVGQKIKISGSVSKSQTHKVVKGDTLWDISRKYGTTVAKLKSLNGLKSDIIYPGQVLKVK